MLVRLIFTFTLLNTANEFKDYLNFEHGFASAVALHSDLEVSEALDAVASVPAAAVPELAEVLTAACQVGYGVSNSRVQNLLKVRKFQNE